MNEVYLGAGESDLGTGGMWNYTGTSFPGFDWVFARLDLGKSSLYWVRLGLIGFYKVRLD